MTAVSRDIFIGMGIFGTERQRKCQIHPKASLAAESGRWREFTCDRRFLRRYLMPVCGSRLGRRLDLAPGVRQPKPQMVTRRIGQILLDPDVTLTRHQAGMCQ